MRTWRWLSAFAVLALVLAACGQQPAASTDVSGAPAGSGEPAPSGSTGAGEPVAGGTLVFAGARLVASLDPAQTSDGESFRILQQVYEPLVDLVPGSVDELVGVLAEEWTGEPDGTEYVFTLREGVSFHDGTPFNAEAVKTNFDRWQNFTEELQAEAYYYGQVMGGFGPENNVASVEATDEFEVTITLAIPDPQFIYGISLPAFGIVSPAVLAEMSADDAATSTFGTEVSLGGTGPFILQEYTPDDSAVLVRNEDYWGEPAYLDRVIVRPILEPTARLQALEGGSIQGYDLVSPSDYETIEGMEGFQLVPRESFNALYLATNPTSRDIAAEGVVIDEETTLPNPYEGGGDTPLTDVLVRQAIAQAIDKAALIETFYAGQGEPADIFLSPQSQWYTTEGVDVWQFDEDAARAALAEAGFDEANKPTIYFWYPTAVTRPYMPDPEGIFEAMKGMLENVGFEVVAGSSDWSTEYTTAAQNGAYEMHLLGWTGDYDDPANWYGIHFAYDEEGNPAAQFGFDPEGFQELLTEANAAVEPEARKQAWLEVYKVVNDEVGFVPIAHGDTRLAFTDEVQNYLPNPTGSESFASVWLTGGGQ